MIGVILSGGFSTRAGTDKGLYKRDGFAQVLLAKKLLNKIGLNAYLSLRNEQRGEYQSYFLVDEMVIDLNLTSGPFNGITSIQERFPDEDLLVLPSDLPNMDSKVLQLLLDTYNKQPNFDYYIYSNDKVIEPLCGIYCKKNLLATIIELKKKNCSNRQNKPKNGISLMELIKNGNTKYLPLPNEWEYYFQNYNEKGYYSFVK